MKAALVGIGGLTLSAAEERMLRAFPAAGVILFGRNIADPMQLAGLTGALRNVLPRQAVLMVDQEGGRVARLRPPHWRAHPPAAAIGELFESRPEAGLRAAWLTGALIGADCAAASFDVVTAPVLDRRILGASDAIGDRAYSGNPDAVAQLGASVAQGLLAAGMQPVAKHAPGHGRARVDSHVASPVVDGSEQDADVLPFTLNAHLPWVMTSHILYPAWDAELPATLSPAVIGTIIRGRIGFKGVLVTDDLAMQALSGEPAELARQALTAGCDLALYCSGQPAPTRRLLETCPEATPRAEARLAAARALADSRRVSLDAEALATERDRLLA